MRTYKIDREGGQKSVGPICRQKPAHLGKNEKISTPGKVEILGNSSQVNWSRRREDKIQIDRKIR